MLLLSLAGRAPDSAATLVLRDHGPRPPSPPSPSPGPPSPCKLVPDMDSNGDVISTGHASSAAGPHPGAPYGARAPTLSFRARITP